MRNWLIHIPSMLAIALGHTCAPASAQANPDGGPWAPVLIDMESIEVVPRQARPGEEAHIRFRCREKHAAKITRLGLFTAPSLIEDTEVPGLDVESGTFSYTIPAERLRFPGTYELRLSLEFRWDDGETYHRSPPLGTLTVHPFARHIYTAETFADELGAARDVTANARKLIDEHGETGRFGSLFADVATALGRAQEHFGTGNHPDARKSIYKATSLARFAADHMDRADYLLDIRRFLAEHPPQQKPCLTLMPGHGDITDEDHERIRWLGTDTVVHSVPAEIAKLEAAGFRTVVSKAPARFSEPSALKNPLQRQQRYLLSDLVKATGERCAMDPLHGFIKGHFEPDARDPHRYWRVYDATTARSLPTGSWDFTADTGELLIDPAVPGHEYRVATLVFCGNLPFFRRFAEPTFPDVQDAILRRMEGYFKQLPGLDVYRPTSLFYAFPKIEKRVTGHPTLAKASWHNFYGYQWGTSPEMQAAFEEQTGIPSGGAVPHA